MSDKKLDSQSGVYSLLSRVFLQDIPSVTLLAFFLLVVVDSVFVFSSLLLLAPIAELLSDNAHQISTGIISVALTKLEAFLGSSLNWTDVLIIFIVINLLRSFTEIALAFWVLKIKYAKSKQLMSKILSAFLATDFLYLKRADRGHLINTITRECARYADAHGMLFDSLSVLLQLTIYISVPILLTPEVSIYTLSLLAVISLPFVALSKKAKMFGDSARRTANFCTRSVFDIIQHAQVIKSHNCEKRELDTYDKHLNKHIKDVCSYTLLARSVPVFLQPLSLVAASIALYLSSTIYGSVVFGAPILWSVLRIYPILGRVLNLNIALHTLHPSRVQVDALLTEFGSNKERSGTKSLNDQVESITLNDVSFGYPNGTTALKKFSFDFKRGNIYLIRGPSGVGKTSFLNLVAGELSPQTGTILVQGVKMTELDSELRRAIYAYLPQNPSLLNRSVRQNVTFGSVKTDTEVWNALKAASAEKIVQKLEDGLNQEILEFGDSLSGGERQRICLARLINKNADVIILDEPTSALDDENRDLIMKVLTRFRKEKIIFVVSHDDKFEDIADEIITLK